MVDASCAVARTDLDYLHRARVCAACLIVFAAALAGFACSELNEPFVIPSHDFIWELDTIHPLSSGFCAADMWGSSDSNVYLAGQVNDSHVGMVRWDGREWKPVDLWDYGLWGSYFIDGIDSTYFVVTFVKGRNYALEYDCGRWRRLSIPDIKPQITCIDVVSRNEIYIGSTSGILRHDGQGYEWMLDSTDSQYYQGMHLFYPYSILHAQDGNLYFTSIRRRTPQMSFFWKQIDARFVLIDSCEIETPSFGGKLVSHGYDVYSTAVKAFKLVNGRWELLCEKGGFDMALEGNEIFISGENAIYHYNGNDWAEISPRYLLSGRRINYSSIKYINNILFVAVNFGYETWVLRGRRNK